MGRQTIVEWGEYRGTQAVKYGAIALSLCGIKGPSAEVPSRLGSAFHKTGGSGGKNPDASKITKGLKNVTYRDRSEALGTVKKEGSNCLQVETAIKMNIPISLWRMGH